MMCERVVGRGQVMSSLVDPGKKCGFYSECLGRVFSWGKSTISHMTLPLWQDRVLASMKDENQSNGQWLKREGGPSGHGVQW